MSTSKKKVPVPATRWSKRDRKVSAALVARMTRNDDRTQAALKIALLVLMLVAFIGGGAI